MRWIVWILSRDWRVQRVVGVPLGKWSCSSLTPGFYHISISLHHLAPVVTKHQTPHRQTGLLSSILSHEGLQIDYNYLQIDLQKTRWLLVLFNTELLVRALKWKTVFKIVSWRGVTGWERVRAGGWGLSLCNPQTCLQAAGRALIPCSGPLALTSVLTGKLSSDWQDYSPDKDRGHSERTHTY